MFSYYHAQAVSCCPSENKNHLVFLKTATSFLKAVTWVEMTLVRIFTPIQKGGETAIDKTFCGWSSDLNGRNLARGWIANVKSLDCDGAVPMPTIHGTCTQPSVRLEMCECAKTDQKIQLLCGVR